MRKHKTKYASGYRLIFGYLGIFLVFIGAICLMPIIFLLPFYQNEANTSLSFVIPGVSSILIGLALFFLLIFRREKAQLGKFQDSILLVLIWVFAILICSVPFMLRGLGSGDMSYARSFSDSVFETASGFCTIGLTLFDFSEAAPGYHLFVFYRAILLLNGGVGLVLVVTSAISDRYGLKLYTAEGHNDKLMPNLAKSARMILLIYLGYITLGTLLFWIAGGMPIFDALCHSISAIATGGFSTKAGGIMEVMQSTAANELGIHINTTMINITAILLMILGATNFVIHLLLFQGKWKKIAFDCEVRFFGFCAVIFIPLFFVSVFMQNQLELNWVQSLKEGTYLFFTSISTTGFNLSEITKLGNMSLVLITILMFVGGATSSTAGGIKHYRVVLCFKGIYWSVRDKLAPKNKMFPHQIRHFGVRSEISSAELYEAFGYAFLYMLVVFAGTGVIVGISGGRIEMFNALFEFTSALSSTGLSVGVTNLSAEVVPHIVAVRWVLVAGMFLGRLEITVIHFAFVRVFRDMFRLETV